MPTLLLCLRVQLMTGRRRRQADLPDRVLRRSARPHGEVDVLRRPGDNRIDVLVAPGVMSPTDARGAIRRRRLKRSRSPADRASRPFDGTAVITGAGKSQVGRRLGRTGLDPTLEAVLRAIADAGLDIDDVDGIISYRAPRPVRPVSPAPASPRSAPHSAYAAAGTCRRWRPPDRSVR